MKNLELPKNIISSMSDDPCGIYAIYREDIQGFRYAYIGQSKHCLTRIQEHLKNYSLHIDCSLKKWGLKALGEKEGYQIVILERCSSDLLDEKETQYCLKYAYAGYQLLNKTGGKLGKGRLDLDTGERKKPKGYRDGLTQGYKNCIKDINKFLNGKLTILIDGKPDKVKLRYLEKLTNLLKSD